MKSPSEITSVIHSGFLIRSCNTAAHDRESKKVGSMIGGLMLLCGVGGMILIAWWSLERDDLPPAQAATGLLALRSFSARQVARKQGTLGSEQSRRPKSGKRRPAPAGTLPKDAADAAPATRRSEEAPARRQAEAQPARRPAAQQNRDSSKPAFNRQEMADIAREIEDAPSPLGQQRKPGQPRY